MYGIITKLYKYCIFNLLKGIGYDDISVAHPKEILLKTKSEKKNHKVDSLKLAKLHLVGMIPESHLLDNEDERIYRHLLIPKAKLRKLIAPTKNSIIGYLKREGLFELGHSIRSFLMDNFCSSGSLQSLISMFSFPDVVNF